MRRGVKFCGGCQSEFDRPAALRIIEKTLGEKIRPAVQGKTYDEIYVICGCSTRCADVSGLSAGRLIYVDCMPQVFDTTI